MSSRFRLVLLGSVLALAGSVSLAPAVVAAPAAPSDCPATLPLSGVDDGAEGVGWTVVRGTEPKPFAVEILGAYPSGILPGHDVILARISDLGGAHFIADAGGAWAGMSGSPIYIGDALIGALAYGFSTGPSTLIGITPIDEMLDIAANGEMADPDEPLRLSPAAVRDLRVAAPKAVASSFARLRIPVATPPSSTYRTKGLRLADRKRLRRLADPRLALDRAGLLRVPLVAKASRVGIADTGERPVAGGNFAASLATGDAVAVGVGTTTWVCGSKVLAFGHPMLMDGAANLGALHARSLDIVDDPTVDPFKVAVPGAMFGRVVADQLTGIGARIGKEPTNVLNVTSQVRDGGRSRDGASDISVPTSWLRSSLLASHVSGNVISVAQRDTEGSASVSMTVMGRRADGSRFEVLLGDRWIATNGPVGYFYTVAEAAQTAAATFYSLFADNPFEEVKIDSVHLDIELGTARRWAIESIQVRSGNGAWRPMGGKLRAKPGTELTVRFRLADLGTASGWAVPGPNAKRTTRLIRVVVPRGARAIQAGHGLGIDPMSSGVAAFSFGGLRHELSSAVRSDELFVRIGNREERRRMLRVLDGPTLQARIVR